MNILRDFVENVIGKQPEDFYADFLSCFHLVKMNSGEFITLPGRVENRVGFLVEGITRTYFCDSQGKEFTKYFNQPGSFIGAYTSMITGEPSQLYIQTMSPVQFYQASYIQLNRLADEHPVTDRLFRRLAEFLLVKKEQREIQLAQLQASERYEIFKNQFPGLEQQISQYHIASYLGISATQLSRIRARRSA